MQALLRRLAIVTLAIALFAPPILSSSNDEGTFEQRAAREFITAQEHFTASRFDEALAAAELGLEYAPDHRALQDLAARAAEQLKDNDRALFWTTTLLEQLGDSKDDRTLAATLAARVTTLDVVGQQAAESVKKFETLADSMLLLAKSCAARKLYVNAVDLFLACKGTRHEIKAEVELDKLYEKGDVSTALLQSGMDLRKRELTAEKARRIAAQDAKHATWATAMEKETRGYDIRTDMGTEILNDIATAMDEMNRFYRKVFNTRGTPKKCRIETFRTRAEFDAAHPGEPPEVRGFYSPDENKIVTYDSRSDGLPLSAFWSTLFHESSHQFTQEISKTTIPDWVNEGTASYFEGARLLPSGAVETNLIPRSRIRELGWILKARQPKLKDVISFREEGSYPGDYYPVGWSLVYLCHNFEDEKCERPYLAAYNAFLESWRKNNEKSSAFDRFVDYFVAKPKRAGVASFEDFEKLWSGWARALHAVYFGGPEQADELLAKARKQAQLGKLDAAVESYRFALRKRPDDAAALLELADVQATQKQTDGALLSYRRAFALARQRDPELVVPGLTRKHGELAADCQTRIDKLDKSIGDGIRQTVTGFGAAAAETAEKYWKGGYPRQALGVIEDAIDLLRGDHRLQALAEQIREEAAVDRARWHRVAIGPALEGFDGSGGFKVEGAALCATFDPTKQAVEEHDLVQYLTLKEPLGSRYVVEALIDPGSEAGFGFAGVVFGESEEEGLQAAVVTPGGSLALFKYDEEKGPDFSEPKATVKAGVIHLGVAVQLVPGATQGTLTFLVDGQPAGHETFAAQGFRAKAGLFAFVSHAKLSELRIRR